MAESAGIVRRILEGQGSPAQEDVVAANAGLAIHCFKGGPLVEGVELARDSIRSGSALKALKGCAGEK